MYGPDLPFSEAISKEVKKERNQHEFNNQLASFAKLLKRKESILFFNEIYDQAKQRKQSMKSEK